MRRLVPSLTALRAFEAAGRHRSFSRAALELNVTQGAISRQVRALEKEVGVRLFERLTRRIELTDSGRQYLQEIQFAFDHVARATGGLTGQREHSILTISVLPSVASFWLMPRLGGFSQQHPEIETRITTSIRPVDLPSGEADVAIRVGALPGARYDARQPRIDLEMVTNWRDIHADEFFPDVLVPVYSPKLVRPGESLRSPADIARYPLIHTTSRANAWWDWFKANGVEHVGGGAHFEFGHFFMSLNAARDGQGIAIVPTILLLGRDNDDLCKATFGVVPSAGNYHILTVRHRAQEPQIAAFRSWLHQQMREASASLATRA